MGEPRDRPLPSAKMHFLRCARLQHKKADSTLSASQPVPQASTRRALHRLTSEVERDPVHSVRYGRQRLMAISLAMGKQQIQSHRDFGSFQSPENSFVREASEDVRLKSTTRTKGFVWLSQVYIPFLSSCTLLKQNLSLQNTPPIFQKSAAKPYS